MRNAAIKLGLLALAVLGQSACGSDQGSPPGPLGAQSGGSKNGGATGGAPTTGGQQSQGGTALGGQSTAGGAVSSGGTTATGGNGQTGGQVGSGGSKTGGQSAVGGSVTGGTNSSGGTQASGGTKATGGVASGGNPASGGQSSSGGATGTGGASTGGGTSTGGKASGGTASGGMASGGAAAGGTASGGSATGGATATGGQATGGTATGGTASGGTATGGTATGGQGTAGTLPSITVYIAGDSTVSNYTDTASTTDQAGWGQMLHEVFSTRVTVDNRAVGGRTALWFALEGAVDKIMSTIKAGDYFLIQWGTNDSNTTATFTVNGTTYPRYADPATDFKTQLKTYYLDPARAKNATPVLVTPPPRNSAYCTGGNSLSRWAAAMRELGAAENVAVVDLNTDTVNYLKAICPSPTPENFFFLKADGTVDGTHFQENGARTMAGFIADDIATLGLPLAAYLL